MEFSNIDKLEKKISREDKFLDDLAIKLEDVKETYIYIKSLAKYYWVEAKLFFSPNDVQNNTLLSNKELKLVRQY
ncbi:MAG: hypothetical protein H6767_03820 [Candidatus Peribacteria bacterium]|nr:MAG: hypothetical protein H6767_03820 [Candidatus Peribacteria bacterium]